MQDLKAQSKTITHNCPKCDSELVSLPLGSEYHYHCLNPRCGSDWYVADLMADVSQRLRASAEKIQSEKGEE